MSGMEPMLLGAALGGGISAARGGNPITGALLGGIGGGVFGGASGLASAKLAAAAPTGTGALAGGGGSGMFTAGTQLANPMAAGGGTYFASGMPAASAASAGNAVAGGSGMFTAGSQLANPMASGTYFSSGLPSSSATSAGNMIQGTAASTPAMSAPTLMQTIKEIPNSFGTFSRENPLVTNMGGQMLMDEFRTQPMAAAAPPGLLRGTPSPEQPMQYAMQMPQVSLI